MPAQLHVLQLDITQSEYAEIKVFTSIADREHRLHRNPLKETNVIMDYTLYTFVGVWKSFRTKYKPFDC